MATAARANKYLPALRDGIVKGAYLMGAEHPATIKGHAPPIPPEQVSPFAKIREQLAEAQRRLEEITQKVNHERRLRRG